MRGARVINGVMPLDCRRLDVCERENHTQVDLPLPLRPPPPPTSPLLCRWCSKTKPAARSPLVGSVAGGFTGHITAGTHPTRHTRHTPLHQSAGPCLPPAQRDGTMAEEGEVERELIKLDYEELDEVTGFKKVDWTIWCALEEWKQKPEDDREPPGDPSDPDSRVEWAKWYATEGPLKPPGDDAKAQTQFENRCVSVVKLGLYAGPRDEFNQRNGKAKAIYANGDIYEGQFFEGKKNGQGKYISRSLGKSEVDTLIEQMVMRLPEADRVHSPLNQCYTVAPHKHDEFVRSATSTLAVGEEIVKTALEFGYHPFYLGDYQNGVRNGIGVMKSRDGSVYKGEWASGQRSGQGLLYFVNGDTYSGNWKDGCKSGYGTYSFAYWSKEMRDGKPYYSLTEGGDYRGEWGEEGYSEEVDGEKVAKVAKGVIKEGEWRMPGGFHYEGTFNRFSEPHTRDPPPMVLQADGTPPPIAKTYMHFPKMGLAHAGVMKKGQWAPQYNLIAVEAPIESAA